MLERDRLTSGCGSKDDSRQRAASAIVLIGVAITSSSGDTLQSFVVVGGMIMAERANEEK